MAGLAVFAQKKEQGEAIVVSTAYDALFAALLEENGVDAILVGDSAGMVLLGYPTTLQVTFDEMLLFTRAVTRGVKKIPVIADLPFNTYQKSRAQAVDMGCRMMQQGWCQAVKLEGGTPVLPQIRGLVQAGVPVVGHLGLTPQSVHQLGGYKAQGKTRAEAEHLKEEALRVQEAGASALVLECVPAGVAGEITASLTIPTIGIGAGKDVSGQVLVLHDYLGLTPGKTPRFVKKYLDGRWAVGTAVKAYVQEVKNHQFPAAEHTIAAGSEAAAPYGQATPKTPLKVVSE